jgi:hypothetical protein
LKVDHVYRIQLHRPSRIHQLFGGVKCIAKIPNSGNRHAGELQVNRVRASQQATIGDSRPSTLGHKIVDDNNEHNEQQQMYKRPGDVRHQADKPQYDQCDDYG